MKSINTVHCIGRHFLLLMLTVLLASANTGFSHEIVLEWNRGLEPHTRDWSVSFGSLYLDQNNRINISGYLGLHYVTPSFCASYCWLGQLSENNDSLTFQRTWGDSTHLFGAYKILPFRDRFILSCAILDIIPWSINESSITRRPALFYLDENFDSLTFVEFAEGKEAYVEDAFINDDGSVDVFVNYYPNNPLGLYKFSSERELVLEREYEHTDFVGGLIGESVNYITKCRNGDYLIPFKASILRERRGLGLRLVSNCGGLARLNEDGEISWVDVQIDSIMWFPPDYSYTKTGIMYNSLEHSSGVIYSIGSTMVMTEDDEYWRIGLYKYAPNGERLWRRYYSDNWGASSEWIQIIELRDDILAVFGRVGYRAHDDREEGMYVALIDTAGELLTDTFIRGDWIRDIGDRFTQVLQVAPNRVLALTYMYDRLVSIRFDLDPPDAALEEDAALPTAFSLSPPYPNPFNSSTRLDYALPAAGRVSLRVYDLSGREVLTGINRMDRIESAGRHSVMLDGAGLPSGVYIARLTTPVGDTASRKLLLLR